ncbi:MAG: hypothetical protein IJ370_09135 [Oscillospiraceae bacterium]|nr:hypothetical protein [Oscillospiraceae bacterium]MBQ8338566.1 hypothetical protein [Oscillospiraceae bacterium]
MPNDMRDGLIKILKDVLPTRGMASGIPIIQKWDYGATADKLLANGVILLPCKEGDVLQKDGIEYKVDHWNIVATAFSKDGKGKLFNIEKAGKVIKTKERESDG